ncbi:hypothetical protein PPROV_000578800 [Pycnococcus provasolii]|uniref:Uncharacterized protein n=1 Tax=Pycnococcus provasolii TaxID=41880 RepID=A0A830HK00_9CHLO|nr:hypothetical protein PPROV_000578800 [Pycnococcus provasolii]
MTRFAEVRDDDDIERQLFGDYEAPQPGWPGTPSTTTTARPTSTTSLVTFFSMRGETVRVTHVGLSVTDASGQLMFRMSAAVGYLRVMNITGTLRWTCFRGTWT